ncbi:hypothetical protein CANCADRAFT_19577, partial [Tortispora caseinolytica NRRL Y-17796]
SSSTESVESQKRLKYFQFLYSRQFWVIFVLGQLLSLSIVATNTFTTYLANSGNSIPAFQSFFNYAILGFFFTPWTIYKYGIRRFGRILLHDGWKYFLFAFADVQGNYFIVKAYQYTSLLSAEVLDMWAIVFVVILSFLFLKVRYKWVQIIGIVVCLVGMSLIIVSDSLTDKDYAATDRVKGDFFVIIAASCYGISNVLQEFFVSEKPIYEVLGQLGFWGIFINGVQMAIFDRNSLKQATWGGQVAGWFVGYTLCLLFLYIAAPFLLRMSSATFYNMSLLTSDFWGLIVGIRVFGYTVYWLYPVGFVFTILGMVIYHVVIINPYGESAKPWLGERQEGGIDGIGTAKHRLAQKHGSISVLSEEQEIPETTMD